MGIGCAGIRQRALNGPRLGTEAGGLPRRRGLSRARHRAPRAAGARSSGNVPRIPRALCALPSLTERQPIMGGHLRTAFAALPAAQSLTPVLTDVLAARSWKAREQHLSAAKPAPQAKDRNKQNGTEANVRARTAAFVLSVVLVFYLGLCSWEGALALYDGFTGGGAASGLLGGAVLVFGFFGGWFLVREIRFGFATERLAKQLDDEGGLRQEEVDTLPRSPGGRVERAAADR